MDKEDLAVQLDREDRVQRCRMIQQLLIGMTLLGRLTFFLARQTTSSAPGDSELCLFSAYGHRQGGDSLPQQAMRQVLCSI